MLFFYRSESLLIAFLASGSGNGPPIDDPLLIGGTETKKEEAEGVEGGVVKANKGMILRKSVEYIRSTFFPLK